MARLQMRVAVEHVELAAPFRISGFVFERQEIVVVTLSDGAHRGCSLRRHCWRMAWLAEKE